MKDLARILAAAVIGLGLGAASVDTSPERDLAFSALGSIPKCFGKPVSEMGGPGPDVMIGTRVRDVFHGRGGDDAIFGLSGWDRACGGKGSDSIDAGPGVDRVNGGRGADDCRNTEIRRKCEGGG